MPQYMLSVFGPLERKKYGDYDSKEAMLEAFGTVGAFNNKIVEQGYFVFANGLEPAGTAITVDGQGEEPVTTSGPHLQNDEHLGGFWVIDVPDLETAVALAAEGSKACGGKVEVRPFQTEESVRAMLED